jgi:hypothetical protein
MSTYDTCVVGAGPSGLSLAWYLAKMGKTVIVIDREQSIGGCHRVRRVGSGLFTEHGPRIYGSAFLNMKSWLKELGLNMDEYFTPYQFTLSSVGGQSLWDMELSEIVDLGYEFIRLMFTESYARNTSLLTFMRENQFSEKTVEYFDRMCRLLDGAGANRFTLYELLQAMNQNYFYQILQPLKPLDLDLFPAIEAKLRSTGKIEIALDHEIVKIERSGGEIRSLITKKNFEVIANQYFFTTPVSNLIKIFESSNINNTYTDYLKHWYETNKYIVYVPITFHWDTKVDLPKVWGYPKSDWGLAFITLSDYTKFQHPQSKTMITTALSVLDNPSRRTGKTVNQTANENELLTEAFRQLQESFPNIPPPTHAIISPGVYQKVCSRTGKLEWKTKDDSFVLTDKTEPLPTTIPFLSNAHTVGPHNGQTIYAITSFDSAISNVRAFLGIELDKPFTIHMLIRSVVSIICIFCIAYFF